MADSLLSKASKAYRGRKFTLAVRLLEPNITKYRDSFRFYYLLGSSCLYLKDYSGANTYLERAYAIEDQSAECALALSAIALAKGDMTRALEICLRHLEMDPQSRKVKRALAFIRDNSGNDLSNLVRGVRARKLLFPPLAVKVPAWIPAALGAIALGVALAFTPILKALFPDKPTRSSEVSALALDPGDLRREGPASGSKEELSDAAIGEAFGKAKACFLAYDDYGAQVEINRIKRSNASSYVKAKASAIESRLKAPDFASFKKGPSYEEFSADPGLYAGCYVVWKGGISNLAVGKDAIRFDFLVGYEDKKLLLGVIPVALGFAVELDSERPLELLARIALDAGAASLVGLAVHQGRPGQ